MILRYERLHRHPAIFKAFTGLYVVEFDELFSDVVPLLAAADQQRRTRRERKRAPGAGHPFDLPDRDQVLLCVVWLRRYPTHEVLGYLFDVGEWTAGRVIHRVLPVLEASGLDTMRMPDPGKKRRRSLDALLAETPDLIVLVDSFEQRVQRNRNRSEADKHYSGKKKQHTLKTQIVIDELTGEICDVSESVAGPTADITLLRESGVLERLPEGVGAGGDLAYVGIDKLHPCGLGVTPRRKPRGKDRPPEDMPTTGHLPNGASRWSTRLGACGGTNVWHSWSKSIALTTVVEYGRWSGWSTVSCSATPLPDPFGVGGRASCLPIVQLIY